VAALPAAGPSPAPRPGGLIAPVREMIFQGATNAVATRYVPGVGPGHLSKEPPLAPLLGKRLVPHYEASRPEVLGRLPCTFSSPNCPYPPAAEVLRRSTPSQINSSPRPEDGPDQALLPLEPLRSPAFSRAASPDLPPSPLHNANAGRLALKEQQHSLVMSMAAPRKSLQEPLGKNSLAVTPSRAASPLQERPVQTVAATLSSTMPSPHAPYRERSVQNLAATLPSPVPSPAPHREERPVQLMADSFSTASLRAASPIRETPKPESAKPESGLSPQDVIAAYAGDLRRRLTQESPVLAARGRPVQPPEAQLVQAVNKVGSYVGSASVSLDSSAPRSPLQGRVDGGSPPQQNQQDSSAPGTTLQCRMNSGSSPQRNQQVGSYVSSANVSVDSSAPRSPLQCRVNGGSPPQQSQQVGSYVGSASVSLDSSAPKSTGQCRVNDDSPHQQNQQAGSYVGSASVSLDSSAPRSTGQCRVNDGSPHEQNQKVGSYVSPATLSVDASTTGSPLRCRLRGTSPSQQNQQVGDSLAYIARQVEAALLPLKDTTTPVSANAKSIPSRERKVCQVAQAKEDIWRQRALEAERQKATETFQMANVSSELQEAREEVRSLNRNHQLAEATWMQKFKNVEGSMQTLRMELQEAHHTASLCGPPGRTESLRQELHDALASEAEAATAAAQARSSCENSLLELCNLHQRQLHEREMQFEAKLSRADESLRAALEEHRQGQAALEESRHEQAALLTRNDELVAALEEQRHDRASQSLLRMEGEEWIHKETLNAAELQALHGDVQKATANATVMQAVPWTQRRTECADTLENDVEADDIMRKPTLEFDLVP